MWIAGYLWSPVLASPLLPLRRALLGSDAHISFPPACPVPGWAFKPSLPVKSSDSPVIWVPVQLTRRESPVMRTEVLVFSWIKKEIKVLWVFQCYTLSHTEFSGSCLNLCFWYFEVCVLKHKTFFNRQRRRISCSLNQKAVSKIWRKWQPTPVFLPGKVHGQEPGGLQPMGFHDWAHV